MTAAVAKRAAGQVAAPQTPQAPAVDVGDLLQRFEHGWVIVEVCCSALARAPEREPTCDFEIVVSLELVVSLMTECLTLRDKEDVQQVLPSILDQAIYDVSALLGVLLMMANDQGSEFTTDDATTARFLRVVQERLMQGIKTLTAMKGASA